MLKPYEIMSIINIELGEEKAKELSKKIQDQITTFGGSIKKDDFWGKRKLSYEINHQTEGFYDVVEFEIETSKVLTLKQKLNLMQGVVRYLVTAK